MAGKYPIISADHVVMKKQKFNTYEEFQNKEYELKEISDSIEIYNILKETVYNKAFERYTFVKKEMKEILKDEYKEDLKKTIGNYSISELLEDLIVAEDVIAKYKGEYFLNYIENNNLVKKSRECSNVIKTLKERVSKRSYLFLEELNQMEAQISV